MLHRPCPQIITTRDLVVGHALHASDLALVDMERRHHGLGNVGEEEEEEAAALLVHLS